MSSTISQLAKDLHNVIEDRDKHKTSPIDTRATVVDVEDDIIWVHFPGGVERTPVTKTLSAKKGDVVQVRASDGKAWIVGNATNPPTDDTVAYQARDVADTAHEAATKAWEEAESAHEAADTAWEYADSAHEAATVAWGHAEEALNSAFQASIAADTANGAAQRALTDAGTAHTMAEQAIGDAAAANEAATVAQGAAEDAKVDAATAHDMALEAIGYAETAQGAAEEAITSAGIADSKAEEAINSARTANVAASGAISSLGIVEDVLGTLDWISKHAEYKPTTDTTVVPAKYYFIRSGSGTSASPYVYSPIVPEEGVNPSSLGYYEIDSIEEGVSNFVSTHLALGDNGLYIQTADGDGTSRMLVSPTEGVVLYGPNGEAVATYGSDITVGNAEDFHIKIDNQEVGFYDGNTKVAYINNKRLYITQSVVLDEMMVGNNKWVWRYDNRDDSIILKWIGS